MNRALAVRMDQRQKLVRQALRQTCRVAEDTKLNKGQWNVCAQVEMFPQACCLLNDVLSALVCCGGSYRINITISYKQKHLSV